MYRSKSSNFSPLTFRCNKVESAPMPPCLKSPHLYLVYLQDSNHLIEWGPLTTSECVYTPKLILSVIGSSQEKTWTGWKNDSFIELQVKKQTEPATDENADKLFYNLGKRLVDVKGEATDMLTRQGEDASRVIDDQVRDDQPMNAKPSLRLNYSVTDNPDVDRPTTALRQYILYALTKNEEADDKCIECAITMKDVEDEHTLKAMQEKGVPVLVLKDACKNSNATVIEKSRDWIIHLANGSNSHCEHPILDCNENDFSEKLLDHIISYFRAEGDRGSDERHLAKLRVYLDMKLMYEANEPGTSSLSFKNWILKDDPFTYSLLDLSVMLSRARCVKHCLKHVKTLKESKIKIPDKTLHKDVIQIVNEMLEQDIGNFTSEKQKKVASDNGITMAGSLLSLLLYLDNIKLAKSLELFQGGTTSELLDEAVLLRRFTFAKYLLKHMNLEDLFPEFEISQVDLSPEVEKWIREILEEPKKDDHSKMLKEPKKDDHSKMLKEPKKDDHSKMLKEPKKDDHSKMLKEPKKDDHSKMPEKPKKDDHSKMLGKPKKDDHELYLRRTFIRSLVLKRYEISKYVWRKFDSPVAAALLGYKVLRLMSGEAEKEESGLDTENDKRLSCMLYFEKQAVKGVNTCYKCNPKRTVDLLGMRRQGWGNTTYFEIAYTAKCNEFLSTDPCHEISKRVWFWGTAEGEPESYPEGPTPRTMYYADQISRVAYLLIYGLLLVRYLETKTFQPLEGIIWALTFFELLNIGVSGDLAGLLVFRRRNSLRLYTSTTFIVAWTLRYLAYSSQENEYLMSWARMAFGLNYIGFSVRFLHGYYANKNLGPMIVMFKNIGYFLLQFYGVILIFFISYGVASQSVYFHGSRYDPLLIFYQSFWTMLGQYPLLDEIGFKGAEESYECTSDDCLTRAERYFLAIILGIYAVIINILLFNLLIAKFSAIINIDQKKWRQTWYIQSLEMTIMYSRRKVWPPLIVLFQPIWLIWALHKSRTCCSKDKSPFIVKNSDSMFESDVMNMYIDQVERSEEVMEKNPLSKWFADDMETEALMENVEMRLHDAISKSQSPQPEIKKVDEQPNPLEDNDSTVQEENESKAEENENVSTDLKEDVHNEIMDLKEDVHNEIMDLKEHTQNVVHENLDKLSHKIQDASVENYNFLMEQLNLSTSTILESLSKNQPAGEAMSVSLSKEDISSIAAEVVKQMNRVRTPRKSAVEDEHPLWREVYGKPEEDHANKEVASIVFKGRWPTQVGKTKKGKRRKEAYFAVRTRHRYGPKWQCYKVTDDGTKVTRKRPQTAPEGARNLNASEVNDPNHSD